MRVTLIFALVLACAIGALANNGHPPPPNERHDFDLQYCIKYSNKFNRSSCIACNIVLGMWCESEEFYAMCDNSMANIAKNNDRQIPCSVCEDVEKSLFVRNAQAAMHIIRHDCDACDVYRQQNDILADRAVSHMNKHVEKSSKKDCGELCMLEECIEMSKDKEFSGQGALQCRQSIIEKCTSKVLPPR